MKQCVTGSVRAEGILGLGLLQLPFGDTNADASVAGVVSVPLSQGTASVRSQVGSAPTDRKGHGARVRKRPRPVDRGDRDPPDTGT